jgi:hypothetical protein
MNSNYHNCKLVGARPRSSRAAPQSRPVFFLYGRGAGF